MKVRPDNVEALYNPGVALQQLERLDEAAQRDMLIYNVNVIRQSSSGSLPTVRKQETDLIPKFNPGLPL